MLVLDNRKVNLRPMQRLLCFTHPLHLHGELALFDLVLREHLEMRGEAEGLHRPYEPFRRIVLVPLDGVAVVSWELVVEVVIPFADGDKRSDHMVLGSVFVVERSLAEPVSEGVDAEGGLWKCQIRSISNKKLHT